MADDEIARLQRLVAQMLADLTAQRMAITAIAVQLAKAQGGSASLKQMHEEAHDYLANHTLIVVPEISAELVKARAEQHIDAILGERDLS